MTLALYGKTRRRRVGLLLGGLLAVVVALGGGLFLRSDGNARALTLGSANGTWTSVTGAPPNFSGGGTNRIYWGESTGSGQSSYKWESGPAVTFTAGQSFLLGAFTHYNNPITGGSITSATLSLPLAFTDPVTTRTVTVVFTHDETPNGANPCAYQGANHQGVNINGCADRVLLPTLGADQDFQVGDNLYTLTFTGFHPNDAATACPATDPGIGEVNIFYTKEETQNKGCVYASLTFVAPVVDVQKAAVGSPINSGDDAKFKITVTNASEAAATGWSLNDPLPAGYTWSKESGPAECTVSGNVLSCSGLSIPAGTPVTPGKVEIVVKASTVDKGCGPITNTLVTITKGALTENAGPATVTVQNCTRTLRIIKVTDTATHPAADFSGTLQPNGGSTEPWSASLAANAGASSTVTKTISGAEYQLIETTLPANWSVVGYRTVGDPSGTATCTGSYSGTSAVVPSDAQNYLVCVKNAYTQPYHVIQVCKVVEQNNDDVDQGGSFEGWVLDKTTGATTSWSVSGVTEGGAAVCTTVDTIPSDHAFNVTEFGFRPATWVSDASGFPWYEDNKGMTHSANPTTVDYTGNVTVTFHNKSNPATKQVVIAKQFTGLNGYEPKDADYPVFTFDPAITPAPACTKDTSKLPDMVSWTCTVPAAWDGTVHESSVAGWEKVTDCPASASFAGGPQVFNFCNRPVGTIEIIKTDNTTAGNLDRPADGDWDFSVTGPSYSASTWIAFGGGTRTITSVPLGTGYTAAETDGRYGQCSTVSNPTGQGYNTTNIAAGPSNLTTPGAKITFVFRNDDCGVVFGTGTLDIWKVRDVVGDGAVDALDSYVAWSVTITGPEFPSGATFPVPATGLHFSSLKEGLYTINEAAQTGWKLVGVRTNETPALTASGSTQVHLNNADVDSVTFYNQPLGSIAVQKNAFTSYNGGPNAAAPDDDDGWTITVTSASCGINTKLTTGADGQAVFTGLPMCADYAVAESEANAASPDFVPLTAARFTNITPNGATLTFNNIKRTNPPFVLPSPTPTSVPPTATPVPPSATPVAPTTPPTQPPPPVTSIAGEKTPGPGQPTPIVPSTGNTGDGGGTGANTIFIVGALIAVATAFGATALTQRRRR